MDTTAQDAAPSKFQEIETIRDPEGIVAPITMRDDRGGEPRFSFALMREFERGGRTEKTVYLNRRHIAAVRRVLDTLEDRIDALEDQIRTERRASRGKR